MPTSTLDAPPVPHTRVPSTLASLVAGSFGGMAQVLVGQPLVSFLPAALPAPWRHIAGAARLHYLHPIMCTLGHHQDPRPDSTSRRIQRPARHRNANDQEGGVSGAVQGNGVVRGLAYCSQCLVG